MNIQANYSEKICKNFCIEFFAELGKYPFGSMPKRDLDCLLFFLLEKHNLTVGNNNREKAKNLNISETKLKSYLIDSYAKYGKDEKEKNLIALLNKLVHATDSNDSAVHASLDGDYLVFIEENPIIKADFAQSLKEKGFYTDTSFNNELVKVKVPSFLGFLLEGKYLKNEDLLKIIKTGENDKKLIEDYLSKNKTLKDCVFDIYDIIKKQDKFGLKTIADITEYAVKTIQAKLDLKK